MKELEEDGLCALRKPRQLRVAILKDDLTMVSIKGDDRQYLDYCQQWKRLFV